MSKLALVATLSFAALPPASADPVIVNAVDFTSTYTLRVSGYRGGNDSAGVSISGGRREGSSSIFPDGLLFPLLWGAGGYQLPPPPNSSSGIFGDFGPVVYTGGVVVSSPIFGGLITPGTFTFPGTAQGYYDAYECAQVGPSLCGPFPNSMIPPSAVPVGRLNVDLPGTITLQVTRALDGIPAYDDFQLSFASSAVATPEPSTAFTLCCGLLILLLTRLSRHLLQCSNATRHHPSSRLLASDPGVRCKFARPRRLAGLWR